jgi:hypothetical protein
MATKFIYENKHQVILQSLAHSQIIIRWETWNRKRQSKEVESVDGLSMQYMRTTGLMIFL